MDEGEATAGETEAPKEVEVRWPACVRVEPDRVSLVDWRWSAPRERLAIEAHQLWGLAPRLVVILALLVMAGGAAWVFGSGVPATSRLVAGILGVSLAWTAVTATLAAYRLGNGPGWGVILKTLVVLPVRLLTAVPVKVTVSPSGRITVYRRPVASGERARRVAIGRFESFRVSGRGLVLDGSKRSMQLRPPESGLELERLAGMLASVAARENGAAAEGEEPEGELEEIRGGPTMASPELMAAPPESARCGVCGTSCREEHEEWVSCGSCGTAHHASCWIYNEGCPILGCASGSGVATPVEKGSGDSSWSKPRQNK